MPKPKQPMHWYTTGEIQFLRDNIAGRSHAEMTELFNECFDTELTVEQIKGTLARYKLCNGRDGCFRSGHTPFNKGMKGLKMGGEKTQFKPGHKPANWVPVGTERVNADGYVDVKIQDGKLQKNWKAKHIIIWEEANGPVPKGHVVIFADGNRLNVTLDNLILLSRKKLAVLNKRRLISKDAELTKTGVIVADICLKIGERKRKKQKRNVKGGDDV
jgi:hypothetical protein